MSHYILDVATKSRTQADGISPCLVFALLKDPSGNPVSGESIRFSVDGDAVFFGENSPKETIIVTDEFGQAETTIYNSTQETVFVKGIYNESGEAIVGSSSCQFIEPALYSMNLELPSRLKRGAPDINTPNRLKITALCNGEANGNSIQSFSVNAPHSPDAPIGLYDAFTLEPIGFDYYGKGNTPGNTDILELIINPFAQTTVRNKIVVTLSYYDLTEESVELFIDVV